jgi:PKD domain
VRPFPRSSLQAGLRSGASRPLLLALAAVATVSVVLGLAVSPANAKVTEVGGTKVGLQRHSAPTALGEGEGQEPASFGNPSGNPVLHEVATYGIYWDPMDRYHGDWQHLINTFLENLGVAGGSMANVFAVDTQYTDKTNQPASDRAPFRGAYTDTNPYPAAGCKDPQPLEAGDAITCLTDKQIREELESFVSTQHGLQKGMSTVFYLLTPPGVTVCLDSGASASHCSSNSASASSFCSYHSDINPDAVTTGDGNTILYAVIPWTAGGLGDYQLTTGDQTAAYDCQDGGFDPSSKPFAEKREKARERTKVEIEAYENATAEEKAQLKLAEELEGPHQQEPNQQPCPTADGGCDAGLADVIINQIAVEQQNTVTDPLLNAWQDSTESHNEATDECRNVFARVLGGGVGAAELTEAGTLFNQSLNEGQYYLNDAFNLAAYKLSYPGVPCLTYAALNPEFTAPNPVNAGESIGFDGMESAIALGGGTSFTAGGAPQTTYATYSWNFGDGSAVVAGYAPGAPVCSASWLSPCAGSVFHSYQYGGSYDVTLTVTDVGGNKASVTNRVTVEGPPRPEGNGSPSQTSASASASSSPSAGATTQGTTAATPAPTAAAAVLSHSLKRALAHGLVVRYSVNEQVAGRFEVLLAASIAHRIGLRGPRARGLAKGTRPQIVIAKAILVTTKGGHNTLKILFGKRTAARLRRLRNVSLMVRLVVRNASPRNPLSTTVLSVVHLKR